MEHILKVVGLGPGSKDYLTLATLEKLKESKKVVLRTKKHPTVAYLESKGINYESFDFVYEEKDNFEDVYSYIVDSLVDMLHTEDVCYAVPGSPFVAENTVQMLIKRAKYDKFKIEFIPAVSFLEAILHTLHKDPIEGLKIIDGLQLEEQIPDVETNMIVTQVYNRMIASQVKLNLMKYYPDDYSIIIIRAAGVPNEEQILETSLYELDRIPWLDHLTSIYIPKVESNKLINYNMNHLLLIMKQLRNGCPWDAKQTHETLKPHLIEETYEVLEALDKKDTDLLEEELGDLLLQILFHAQIASESAHFDMQDVMSRLGRKLVYRHPHVFGEVKVQNASGAIKSWEEMKRKEKGVQTYTEGLLRIPKDLPALMRSYKIQKKASEVGFDWDHVNDALEKVKEEFFELLEVYNTEERDKIREEIGDLIFAVVNVARFLQVDPEIALSSTIEKFIQRFAYIEENAQKSGKKINELSLKEMDALWDMAKTYKNKKKDKKYC